MSVRVRLFAAFREAAGVSELVWPHTEALTVGRLWRRLVAEHPSLAAHTPSAAVNARFAEAEAPVADGDEVAFLPPVSGG